MSMLKQTIKRTMVATLGESRANVVRDLPISLTYATNPLAKPSGRRLRELQDAYRGRRCFIIGNGPSLRDTELSLLKDEITFGLNRIYLMFKELGFQTTFLVAVNENVVEQFGPDLLAQPSPKFIPWHLRGLLPADEGVTFLMPAFRREFCENPLSSGVWDGATVTFVAMQLAFFMGFQQVILVGVDHSFVTQGEPHKLVTSEGPDPNHFSPEYFGKGVKWQLPDLETSELAYRMARERYQGAGREIIDATVGGKLTVFPSRDLKEFF